MQNTHFQLSVLDCFAPCHGDNARQCLSRAALCSQLAKLTRGRVRRKLYRLKNANIRAALMCPGALVEICADHDRYVGLLSVRLNSSDGVRVHTHENWIDAA